VEYYKDLGIMRTEWNTMRGLGWNIMIGLGWNIMGGLGWNIMRLGGILWEYWVDYYYVFHRQSDILFGQSKHKVK
jgi:hypothetical protein